MINNFFNNRLVNNNKSNYYFKICCIYFENFVLFKGFLFDIPSTEIAPASEPKNKDTK